MKKKTDLKRPGISGKKKIKWWDIFMTILVIVLFGGFFVWQTVSIYHQEKHEQEIQERNEALLPAPGTELDHKLVCMVKDVYTGTNLIPVMILDKTYYAGTPKCVKDLHMDQNMRLAIDPFSKRTVDKSLSFITINPNKSGTVLYFESEENAKKYLGK